MTRVETIHDLIQESRNCERAGDIPAALQRARQAVELARALDASPLLPLALICLAKAHFRLGKYTSAQALSHEARSLAEENTPVVVDAWQICANCATEIGSPSEAEMFYTRAASLAREIGYTQGRIAALHGITAGVYLPRGQFELALAAEAEVRQLMQKEGQTTDLIYPLVITIIVYQFTGQHEGAAALLSELEELVAPDSLVEGYLHCLNGNQALEQGAWEEARGRYARARSIAEACGEPWLNIHLRLGMSRYERLLSQGPNALQWAQDACCYASNLNCRYELGRAMIERAQAHWLCGQPEMAQNDLQTAIALLKELEAAFDLAHARLLLAALLHEQKDPQAEQAWRAAVEAILSGGYGYLLQRERRRAYLLVAEYLSHPERELAQLSEQLIAEMDKTPPPALHVCVLGDFALYRGRERVSPALLKQRQAGELLRLLLISPGRRLSREQVIDALWQDKSPAAAINIFHQTTSALRHALEPDLPSKFPSRYLLVEEGQVCLRLPPGSQVDYEQFEVHLRRDEWREAINLWKGEPFYLDRYKDWAALKREELTQGYLRALLCLAREELAGDNAERALEACQRILQTDPWHEQAALLAMHACLKMNNRSGALRIYLNLERRLQDDLGIAPQDELRQLYLSLLK